MRKVIGVIAISLFFGCGNMAKEDKMKDDTKGDFQFVTLDPGHFHAALVQKSMYADVDSTIHVYAPEGPEVTDFLSKIESYNTRDDNATAWNVVTHLSDDYLNEMINGKKGNVMVVAGKNSKKIDYVLEAVKAGLNVYADKPLVINEEGFEKLKTAFEIAKENNVLIYDIMTERFESTTMMQKLFSTMPEVFGELVDGTPEQPAISKESVHHFFKYVSGNPLVRPGWFFDINEEGAGIVDVTTHLVDLVQWEAFPLEIIDTTNIAMLNAKSWPTVLSKDNYTKVTKLDNFPTYLEKDLVDGMLHVYCNGEMTYKINGKHAKVSVVWNFQAPEGTGDTHYSIMRGTKSNLIIRQGEEENYKPMLYIEFHEDGDSMDSISDDNPIAKQFPGTTAEKVSNRVYRIVIPEKYKVGHEAHFAQVTENYLKYLKKGALPEWEEPNMIAKYYTIMEAYKMALKNKGN